MRFGYELRSPHIWHPDLNRAQPLQAESLAVPAYTLTGRCHVAMLHVTKVAGKLPAYVAGGMSLPKGCGRAGAGELLA